uniref:Rho-GAP domain-containing protein n=1 Tax=Timema shepardi TaxID=629360 RepID=A0A7R9AN01_TIMSH|nr:unnamed protein product [Timema shepardi]
MSLIVKNDRISTRLFRVPLAHLESDLVLLNSGATVVIPSFVLDACSNIKQSIQTEGLFRKAGSAARQKEIKVQHRRPGCLSHGLKEEGLLPLCTALVITNSLVFHLLFHHEKTSLSSQGFQPISKAHWMQEAQRTQENCTSTTNRERRERVIPTLHQRSVQCVVTHKKPCITDFSIPCLPLCCTCPASNALLDNGGHLAPHHHVIDVANLLKLFFRDLPEPLLPIAFHDVFIRCLLLKDEALQGVLLTCLLLPTIHLNTITFFMEFLKEVTVHHVNNKMDARNLAIIVTPSLMPVEEKLALQCGARLNHHVQIVQMVGKGSPEQEVNHHVPPTEYSTPCVKSAKKRKAQDLTGAFSSKKKRDVLESLPQRVALATVPYTPTQHLHTPTSICSHPKEVALRVSHSSLMSCDRMKPGSGDWALAWLCMIDFVFGLTIINHMACGKDLSGFVWDLIYPLVAVVSIHETINVENYLITPNKVTKQIRPVKKLEVSGESTNDGNGSHRYSLERQWRGLWSKKKRYSTSDVYALSSPLPECSGDKADLLSSDCVSLSIGTGTDINLSDDECLSIQSQESEFVRISKSEYEEIKNRVSAIENRISQEFVNMAIESSQDDQQTSKGNLVSPVNQSRNNANLVQSAYEKTLEESVKLESSSTEQLAKRLGRDLKIRRSIENKIIRSPSARKIGTIRRRSRESAKPDKGNSLNRNQTWHMPIRPSHPQLLKDTLGQLHSRKSLRRGRPNTILTGLPQLTPQTISQRKQETSSVYGNISSNRTNLSQTQEIHTTHISGDYLTKSSFDINSIDSESSSFFPSEVPMTRAQARRVSSFNGFDSLTINNEGFLPLNSCCQENISENAVEEMNKTPRNIGSTPQKWHDMQNFLCRSKASVERQAVSGRASVVKIRNQNAGMVLARTRLFDGSLVSNTSGSCVSSSEKSAKRAKSKKRDKEPLNVYSSQKYNHNIDATQKFGASFAGSQLEIKSMVDLSYWKDDRNERPSKMCTPRRNLSHKSPGAHIGKSTNTHKKSPSLKVTEPMEMHSHLRLKKSESMKTTRILTTPVRRNCTFPVKWPEQAKENNQVPAVSYRAKNSVLTPLKDSNRLQKNNSSPRIASIKNVKVKDHTPNTGMRDTPYIKKPMLVKSPSYIRTPQLGSCSVSKTMTPMKALPSSDSIGTPAISPRKHSPRLLLLKAKYLANK